MSTSTKDKGQKDYGQQYNSILQQLLWQLTQQSTSSGSTAVTSNNTVLPSLGLVNIVTTSCQPSSITNAQSGPASSNVQSMNQSITVPSKPAVASNHIREDKYSYKVKMINPQKKSESIVRQLNGFTSKFKNVKEMRMKLNEEFGEQVPNTLDFSIGYFDGSQQAKVWLYTAEDLKAMYSKHPNGGFISLWCDGNYTEVNHKKRRAEGPDQSTYRQLKEEETDSVFKELREKHTANYDTPRLRLWARMISTGLHDDYDNPPNIPAFSGSINKRARKDSVSDTVSGAAIAIVEALQEKKTDKGPSSAFSGNSPGRLVDIRMKNYEQLRYLQSLFDDGILTEEEYAEQKKSILSCLRKL